MKLGDAAEMARSFTPADVAEYRALSGHHARGKRVPEPLIGALFSRLLGMNLPGLGTMYLKQETTFRGSAAVGEKLTARIEITRMRPEKHLVDLMTRCWNPAGELIADGRALVYVRDVAGADG